MHAIDYNLIRALLLGAAFIHAVPIERLSFKGAIDAVHAWTAAPFLRRARRHGRAQLLARIEPRALKRRHKTTRDSGAWVW